MKVKNVSVAALFLAWAGVANAHNSWLEPKSFQATSGATMPLNLYVGHHGERHSAKLSPRPSWLTSMKVRSKAGTTDLLGSGVAGAAAGVMLQAPGTHLFSLDTSDFRNRMSPKKFSAYLAEESLTGAQAAWRRAPIASRQVRESYRRHAKALVRVGSGPQALAGPATQRIGQRLEIVPEVNPFGLVAGSSLPAKVWFRDRPLKGALVTLTDLDRPKDSPLSMLTDAGGRVSFRLPRPGRWMMNVVWSVPSTAASADFQTSFSSLTFAVPAAS